METNSYFQWHKTGHKCIVNLNKKDQSLNWTSEVDLNGVKFSRGSRGIIVRLSEDVFFLIKQGKVYLPGYVISVEQIQDAKYIHVAWTEEKNGNEVTVSAKHWYALWLDPFTDVKKKHFVRMNKFVRQVACRTDATFWIAKQ